MSGPFVSPNGDVISSALKAAPVGDSRRLMEENFSLAKGQIEKVYTVDDSTVPGKRTFTLYDVKIYRTNGSTELVRGVRGGQPLWGGGVFDFLEVNHGDAGPKTKDPAIDSALKEGAHVLVGFISGQQNAPVILCALPHPSDKAIKRRPKKAQGKRMEGEFQGLNFAIASDGSLSVIFNGPRKPSGESDLSGAASITIDGKGNIKASTNAQQSIEINRETGFVKVVNGTTHITLDKKADKAQVVAKNIEIGTGALQPAVVGDDWKKIMTELLDALAQLTVPTAVGPSGTPINAAQFNQVKGKLQDALSTKHKVEK